MYGISVAISHGGKGAEAEVDQRTRFPGQSFGKRGFEMNCKGSLFQEQLISERKRQPDEQVGGDSAHDAMYADWARTKRVFQRHYYEDGHTRYLQGGIQSPVAERGIEFHDQIRRELQSSHDDD